MMSERESTTTYAETLFDDRVDVNARISNREVLSLIARSLAYLGTVKKLFLSKFTFALVALIPAYIYPWFLKILLDQVIQQQPINQESVPFPFFMQPFLRYIEGMTPLEIMVSVTVTFLLMLFIYGRMGTGLGVNLEFGYDSATQSEGKLSAGGSGMSGVLGMIESLIDIRLNQRLSNNFRTNLFQRLSRLPMKTIDDHRIGDSVYRVLYDAPDLPSLCFSVVFGPLFILIGTLGSFYLLVSSYGQVVPEIVWITVISVPLALIVTIPLSNFVRKIEQYSRASGTATTNAIEESMSNLHAVQSLGGMDRESDRVKDKSRESFRRFRHVVLTRIGVGFIQWSFIGLISIAVLVIVSNHIIDGAMSVGDFATLLPLAGSVSGAGVALGMFWIGLQAEVATVRRVFFFLDVETETTRAQEQQLHSIDRNVCFENVKLVYSNGHVALENVNLDLNIGELVAFVGPTGAGKTSLAYLIPNYYKPTLGRITIDGQDLDKISLESIRNQVSYVFQEHLLLNESIRNNLLLANPTASDQSIQEACEIAGANEFIEALPQKFDTVLGQSGDTLSVGQKQRLCIARGLIRDTRILILDEPTAALDPVSENALVNALRKAAEDRLVIIIAHRLSTIRHADRIVYMEEGQIEEEGTHERLMSNLEGRYHRFVNLQSASSA